MSRLRVGSMIGVTNPLAAKSNLPRSSIEYEPETHTPVQEEKPEEERLGVKGQQCAYGGYANIYNTL